MSNYTGPLSARSVNAWKGLGVGLVIVQAINPPQGYPTGVTRQQLMACRDAGIPTDVYIYLWPTDTPTTVKSRLDLTTGLPVRRLWLDVEEPGVTVSKVAWALEQLDAFSAPQPVGIYTGAWFWTDVRYMVNTTVFSQRALWDSHYDHIPDASRGFKPYGGWAGPTVKQYAGTSTLTGVSNVDLDVLSQSEAALLAS